MSQSLTDQVAAQLRAELGGNAWSLGLAAADDPMAWQLEAERNAQRRARQLCSPDDGEAAQAVVDVMCALWPHGNPEDHDAGWWRTPLGRVCATSLGRAGIEPPEFVTHSVAAAMLGVHRGSVPDMVKSGKLDQLDGKILRSSVLQRVGR